jgi:hypothetical protein
MTAYFLSYAAKMPGNTQSAQGFSGAHAGAPLRVCHVNPAPLSASAEKSGSRIHRDLGIAYSKGG